MLEVEISAAKLATESFLQDGRFLERSKGVKQIERQAPRIFCLMTLRIHVDIEALTRISFVLDSVEARDQERCWEQVRIRCAVRETEFETTGVGNANHVSPVVAGVCDCVR